MSCFNVRRLLPEGKAWRVFTKKLQTKLHKLHTSKAIRKRKTNRFKPTSKSVFWAAFLSLPSRREGKKRIAKVRRLCSSRFRKRIPPVYVDQLFVESMSSTSVAATRKQNFADRSRLGDDQKVAVPAGTSKEEQMNGGRNNTTTADDMWESLVLASPQMHGINERAEEFIARVRAEMQLQEISASHL